MKRGEIVGKRQFGKNLTNVKKTYSELLSEFIKQLKIKGRAEQTIISYEYHNKYFMKFLGEDIYCDEIHLSTLEDYIIYIKEKKHINNAITINSYIRNVSPIIKYGIKKGYILEDFIIPEVKGQETLKTIYSQDELKRLLDTPKKRDFVTIRTWTIIWTLASTGIRARELRELKIKGIDILNRTITVNSTKNKKARVLPVSLSFLEILERYLELREGEPEGYLFCSVYNNRLAMSSLQKSVKNYCNDRGIEKCSLHLFRHTFITNAVNKNVSPLILKRITGHSSMKELNRYYNAKTIDMVNVIDDIAPVSNKKESYFKNGGKKHD
jgi:integrase/recombinase XerD